MGGTHSNKGSSLLETLKTKLIILSKDGTSLRTS